MNRLWIIGLAIVNATIFAAIPEPVITATDTYQGYATVAGRLNAKPESALGVSVRNGNVMYSTVTDSEGRWAVVIRHRSTSVSVNAFELGKNSVQGNTVLSSLPE